MRALVRHVVALVAFGTPCVAVAQPRSVQGRVVVMSRAALEPIRDTWVTLHRVAPDNAGPIDSVRTDAQGRYTLRYRPFGAADAIYFASTRFGGVAYFTRPLRAPDVRGDDAELQVFDTTSRVVPKSVRGRHVIVAAATANSTRDVIEVYEISNDSTVTQVESAGAANGTWSAAVPADAQRFTVREGEIPTDALNLANGRATLHMPLAPGLKQIAFSYTLDANGFPLALSSERSTSVLEVLVEDPRGAVTGPGVEAVAPVVVEGRTFRRFLGSDVPANARVTIDVPSSEAPWTRWILPGLLGVIGVAMVGALARPRRRRVAAAVAAPPDDTADLARRIASLDDAFERDTAPSPEAREAYMRERTALKARLSDVLARR